MAGPPRTPKHPPEPEPDFRLRRRALSAEERVAWRQLAKTVTPFVRPARPEPVAPKPEPVVAKPVVPHPVSLTKTRPSAPQRPPPPNPDRDGLDGSWNRRLGSGAVVPDVSIDLHGHTLASAHARLMHALDQALATGARVMLVIAGKVRESTMATDGKRRGAIRAELPHWIAASRHADRVAAIRAAHPRHGGAGAIYLILRRKK